MCFCWEVNAACLCLFSVHIYASWLFIVYFITFYSIFHYQKVVCKSELPTFQAVRGHIIFQHCAIGLFSHHPPLTELAGAEPSCQSQGCIAGVWQGFMCINVGWCGEQCKYVHIDLITPTVVCVSLSLSIYIQPYYMRFTHVK